jgi:hypothetical protein
MFVTINSISEDRGVRVNMAAPKLSVHSTGSLTLPSLKACSKLIGSSCVFHYNSIASLTSNFTTFSIIPMHRNLPYEQNPVPFESAYSIVVIDMGERRHRMYCLKAALSPGEFTCRRKRTPRYQEETLGDLQRWLPRYGRLLESPKY